MKRLILTRVCLATLLALMSTSYALASVTLSTTNFPDENFRNAVATAAGVSVGSTFDESTLTTLDVSGKNIQSVKGVELLTALTKFVAANNDIQFANFTNNHYLEWLDLSNNAALRGFNSTAGSGSTSTHWITLTNNMPLKHLDLSNCNIGYFVALYSGYNVTSLTWLSLANNPALAGWSNGIAVQAGLEYCDLTNTGQTSTSLAFTASHNKLETLILRGNSSFAYSSSFQYLSALKYLDISNCDIIFRVGGLLDYLKPSNNPNLETLLCSNSRLGTRTEGLDGFTNLKTVDVSNNVTASTVVMTQFWVNGSPLLETLDISGDSELTYLKLNNDYLPRSNFNLVGSEDCTALRSLYLNGNNYSSIAGATQDFNSIPDLAFLYLQSNSGFLGGPLTMGPSDCGNLTGIDLGNNGFTSFSAPSLPSTLTALMLGDNPLMTRLEMHNNPGITKMTSDAVMSDGSGLYLLGNTALTYMDISGDSTQCNYFERIGNNFSLANVPIDTIKASYNKFYTFRNLTAVAGNTNEHCHLAWSNSLNRYYSIYMNSGNSVEQNYEYHSSWPSSPAMADSASLEQLPRLEYLDLSHCQLKDSVYLHKNTELRYLDVSHNRTIARYTTSQDKGKGYRDSGGSTSFTNRSYPDYKKYLWLASPSSSDLEEYTGDYNDTTGLYILDLLDNNKLEYLNISYTGIEQTALTHCHVANARYIWIQDLPNLKYFYADYNGMRSLGVSTKYGKKYQQGLASLERLSAIGMRGADDITMMGSINLHGDVNTRLHYVNFSYSDYDSIGTGTAALLDTLIIKGNPIHYLNMQSNNEIVYIDAQECALKMRGYDPETGTTHAPSIDRYWNGAREHGSYTYLGEVTRETTPLSGLRAIRAYDRPKLTTVLLNKCNDLGEVYCHFDPVLPRIEGFDDLTYTAEETDPLDLVWVNDDYSLIELNLSKNVNLEYLHAYNDKALGNSLGTAGLNLIPNNKLICSWVSNSNLKAFANQAITLDTLWIWQNPELAQLDVTANERLRRLDLHNCMVRNLDVSHNPILIDFNCCNLDSINHDTEQSIWPSYTKYGYEFPGAVPTAINEPGKNSIADLNFSSKNLRTVKADNNDLYSMKGLDGNSSLKVLTYAHNHINAIDLNGCDSISTYDCTHNGRGYFEAEYSRWTQRQPDGNDMDTYHLYYLQLDPNAGDEIDPNYDSFLGYKAGYDSIAGISDNDRVRVFHADGFDPDMVDSFTVNASGPHQGTRTSAPRREDVVCGSDTEPDPSKIYGKVAFLDMYNNTDFPDHQYIEYKYYDGRNASTRGQGETSTFYMVWTAPQVPTDVKEITEDGLTEVTVVSERYYDIGGIERSELIEGVNIVVRQMSDGTTQTIKIVK